MKTVATVMQLTRSLLILTPAEYDKPEGGLSISKKRGSSIPGNFSVPQIFELNESLKDHPYEKSDELAAFVKRCAESVSMELGDIFLCIEDEDILITKEYKHHFESKDKLLLTYARVEAEAVLHQEVEKYTILNFEYGQQYGKANKTEEVSASLFAMSTAILTDIRANFAAAGLKIVKITPPIAGMLYTAKADINSATRAIALISMDFAATRLVVLHNGAPVFQQSFSSVLEDIAEMFMLEFGISKLGAIDLIRQKGLGICNECNSAQTRKQVMSMLDNAAGEILRNLRMVISTLRLDIDQIVLCDALAKIPNIAAYCRQVGLTAPMEKVTNLFSGQSNPPTVTAAAAQRGFDAVSFITLNGLLTMPVLEANLLQGQTNILSAMAKQGENKTGNIVAGVLGVCAAIWMIAIAAFWIGLNIRQNNDTNDLKAEKYVKARELVADEKKWIQLTNNVQTNIDRLPKTQYKFSAMLTQLQKDLLENGIVVNNKDSHNTVSTVKSRTFDNETGEIKDNLDITATLRVNTLPEVKSLVARLEKGKYYKLDVNRSATADETGTADAKQQFYDVDLSLHVTKKGFDRCKFNEEEQAKIDARYSGEEVKTDKTDNGDTEKEPSEKPEESSGEGEA